MIRTACYVSCDGPCGGDPAAVSTSGAVEARAFAKQQGFMRLKIDGRLVDLCENCQYETGAHAQETHPQEPQ